MLGNALPLLKLPAPSIEDPKPPLLKLRDTSIETTAKKPTLETPPPLPVGGSVLIRLQHSPGKRTLSGYAPSRRDGGCRIRTHKR